MMYNCKIKFTLVVTKGTRYLEDTYTKDGTCEQTGTVTCFENGNPTVAGCTGMLDCKADLESEDANYSKLQAKNFKLEEVNDQKIREDVDANGLSEVPIDKQTGTMFEDALIKNANFYAFTQSGLSSCKCENGIASLKLNGSVVSYKDSSINNQYSFTTTEEEEATCTLYKEEGTNEAKLDCTAPTSSKTFNFIESESMNIDGDTTNSLIALETNSEAPLCEVEDNSVIKNSSTSGLSGGATAGIVVGSVVVVAAVGAIVSFVAIPTKAVGVAAANAAAQSIATSSQAGLVVPSATTSAQIAA